MISSAWRFSLYPAEFASKRVLVTGGTEGMGEAIVRRLVSGGARVATTARSPLPAGQTVELFVQADLSTRDGTDKVADHVLRGFGGIDILINVWVDPVRSMARNSLTGSRSKMTAKARSPTPGHAV